MLWFIFQPIICFGYQTTLALPKSCLVWFLINLWDVRCVDLLVLADDLFVKGHLCSRFILTIWWSCFMPFAHLSVTMFNDLIVCNVRFKFRNLKCLIRTMCYFQEPRRRLSNDDRSGPVYLYKSCQSAEC